MTGSVSPILWPTLALVALIFVVWSTLFVQRGRQIRARPPKDADLASSEAARAYFAPVEMPANNLANLFEMPVLFFALVPLLILTGGDDFIQMILGWGYVAARATHSYFHIVVKRVLPRLRAYLASCAILFAMWVGFAIDLIFTAGSAG